MKICLCCDKNEVRTGHYFCPSCEIASANACRAVTGWVNRDRFGVDDNGELFHLDTEPLPLLNPGLDYAGTHTTDTGWHFAVDQHFDSGLWYYNATYPSYRTGDPVGPFDSAEAAYNDAMDIVPA